MIERTLVFIKPDGVERGLIGEIIKRFENAGLKIQVLKMGRVSQEIISKHYPLDDKNYILTLGHVDTTGLPPETLETVYRKNYNIVQKLQEYVMGGPIVKMVLAGGEGTVKLVREMVGKTDPAASAKGTIRGDFGEDSFAVSDQEGRSVRNLIHASGTPEEAKKEIELWFGRDGEN